MNDHSSLRQWVRHLLGWNDSVLTTEALHSRLLKERALADRNGHRFSLLTFQFAPAGRNGDHELLHEMAKDIRFSDEIGWLQEHQVGIILPQTGVSGATLVADRIGQRLDREKLSYQREIFVYPDRGGASDGQSRPGSRRDRRASDPDYTGAGLSQRSRYDDWGQFLATPIPLWKRALDLIGATLMLLFLWPVFLLLSVWIKVCSLDGPVFFTQERIGLNGRPFQMFKFRTMKPDSQKELHTQHFHALMHSEKPLTKLDDLGDPRLLPLAGLIRKTALDELPQIWNVFRGEMSLVGPRPCITYEAREYQLWHMRRFDTLPGLTGLWQVGGKNRTTFTQMMRSDLAYIAGRSFWLDLKILLKTPTAVFQQLIQS